MKVFLTLALVLTSLLTLPLHARVGDTLEQMQAALGPCVPSTSAPAVLPSATEYEFTTEQWWVRAAFVLAKDGRWYCLRAWYRPRNGGFDMAGCEAVLTAENAGGFWVDTHEPSPGWRWRRADGALAQRQFGEPQLAVELPQARAYEAEALALLAARATPPPTPTPTPAPLLRLTSELPPLPEATPQTKVPITPRSEPASRVTPALVGEQLSRSLLKIIAPYVLGAAVFSVTLAFISSFFKRRRRTRASSTAGRGHTSPPPLSPSTHPRTLRDLSPDEFEILVAEVYRRQGYQVALQQAGGSDGGVDILMERNGVRVLVQCKNYHAQKVTVSTVRELYGVVMAEGASGGILVTASDFTQDAREFAEGKSLRLVESHALAAMIAAAEADGAEALLAVAHWAPRFAREVTLLPARCPFCKAPMVQRAGSGGPFWGCRTYPRCKGTRAVRPHFQPA